MNFTINILHSDYKNQFAIHHSFTYDCEFYVDAITNKAQYIDAYVESMLLRMVDDVKRKFYITVNIDDIHTFILDNNLNYIIYGSKNIVSSSIKIPSNIIILNSEYDFYKKDSHVLPNKIELLTNMMNTLSVTEFKNIITQVNFYFGISYTKYYNQNALLNIIYNIKHNSMNSNTNPYIISLLNNIKSFDNNEVATNHNSLIRPRFDIKHTLNIDIIDISMNYVNFILNANDITKSTVFIYQYYLILSNKKYSVIFNINNNSTAIIEFIFNDKGLYINVISDSFTNDISEYYTYDVFNLTIRNKKLNIIENLIN